MLDIFPQSKRRGAMAAACTLLALGLAVVPASAQTVELTPFVGYQFGGSFDQDYEDDDFDFFDDVDVEESESYGLMLNLGLTRSLQFELLYSRQETNLEEDSFLGADLDDVEIEYFHGGVLWQWGDGQVHPYVVASAGGTRFTLADGDDTRFSVGLGGGVKVMFNNHVGLRLDGRFYSTVIDDDDGFFDDDDDFFDDDVRCDRRGRNCISFSDDEYLVQFDAKVGLVLRF